MNQSQKEKATRIYNQMKENVSERDIAIIDAKIGKMKKGPLAKLWQEVLLLYKMMKDPQAAWGAKIAVVGVLLYVVSPFDAIPDAIPFAGLIDDAFIIKLVIKQLHNDLSRYRKKEKKPLCATIKEG